MANPTTGILLNKVTPAAPTGDQNAVFQTDGATPQQSISVYPQRMVGDSGSGGKAGTVPPPGAGDAAAGKFLKADGTWTAPSGGGGSLYFGYGSATASSGQNQITLGSTPSTNAVWVYQNDLLVDPSYWSISGAVITLSSNTFVVGAEIAVHWATTNSTPGSITLGSSGATIPVIRGSNIISGSAASSLTVSLPAGTAAGDFAIILAGTTYTSNPTPTGWTNLSLTNTGLVWSQYGYTRTLTSGDIATGSVTVPIATTFGPAAAVLGIVTFVGATGGIREIEGGNTSTGSITNTTTSAVQNTDAAIYWLTVRQSANTPVITPGSGSATTLQSESVNTLTLLADQSMPGGVLTVVNTWNAAPATGAASQIIIEGVSSSGFPALPPLPVAAGGTGSTSPSLIAGSNVTITGSWPNQTVNASGGASAPATIPDLLFWLETDNLLVSSGNPVGVLLNRTPWSGAPNSAVPASGNTSAVTVSASTLNSLPVVSFPGSTAGRYSINNDNVFTLSNVTVFVVFKPGAIALGDFISGNTGAFEFRMNASGNLEILKCFTASIGTSSGTVSTGSWYQANVTYAAGTGAYAFRLARASSGSGTNAQSITALTSVVGYNLAATNSDLNALVAAIIVYNRVLTSTEITTVETYINSKWGV